MHVCAYTYAYSNCIDGIEIGANVTYAALQTVECVGEISETETEESNCWHSIYEKIVQHYSDEWRAVA